TAAETAAILSQASPQFRLIYLALRQCRARPGELCRATIAEIDRPANVIVLKQHKTARKTGKPRRIRIGKKLCQLTTDHCQLSMSIEYARRRLGHANIATTQHYMHLDEQELAEA